MPTLSYPGTPGTTLYGGIAGGTLLTSFSLDNWDSVTPTRTLFRGGMPFKKGDIPSGSVPEIRRAGGAPVVAQFDERTTWSDGSLKFAVCHMRDTDLAASGSQAYEVYSVTGSFDNTGTKTLASIVATDAITVELSSFAQWNGTSSATRGSGAALLNVSAISTVATRVTKIHSGPVCETYQIWGMFKDGADGSGSEDAHAKGIAYMSVWKDVSDAVEDTEFGVELAQDWWAVASKFRLDYTATLKRNGTTVETYAGIQHPYHSHWLTARKQNDHNHGKRHWVGTVPSLTYLFDQAYWKSTNLVPNYDTTISAASNASITFVPMSSQEHRAALDGTGTYLGRGPFPGCDARTFINRTPVDLRNSRVNAFAGLHVNKHFRDERTRTRDGESADVANTLVPLLWLPKDAADSTFDGLPTPKHAYRGASTDLPSGQGGYVTPLGGTGVWTDTIDASHAASYSLFMYLVEGERYFLETSIDLATFNAQTQNGNVFAGAPNIHWYGNTAARAEMSIPATRWSGIPNFVNQERALGLSANCLVVSAFVPDSDPQGPYMKAWNAHCAEFLGECVTYTPTSLRAAGIGYFSIGTPIGNLNTPWMASLNIMGCCNNFLTTEQAGYKDYAQMIAEEIVALITRHPYEIVGNRIVHTPVLADYSSDNFVGKNDYLTGPYTVTAASNVLSFGTGSAELQLAPIVVANGDLVYFYPVDANGGAKTLPSGYTAGTPLYVINLSGLNFQVSASPGGSVYTVSDGVFVMVGVMTGRAGLTVSANPPQLFGPESTAALVMSAYGYGERAGLASVPAGTYAAAKAFMANVDFESDPRWLLATP